MNSTVFVQVEFWLLVLFSFVAPVAIYWALLARRAVSSRTVLGLGLAFIAIAGLDVYLLQTLSRLSLKSLSLADDAVFLSEVSLALYLLPALFAGIGINMVSHVLVRHLSEAEQRFDNARSNPSDPA